MRPIDTYLAVKWRMSFSSPFRPETDDDLNPHEGLRRLYGLRWAYIGLFSLAAILATWAHIVVPWVPYISVLTLLLAGNLSIYLRLRLLSARTRVSQAELAGQVWIDSVAVAMILYFTDGASNPLAPLLLLPLTLAATLLTLRWVLAMLIFSLSAYALLMFTYIPLTQPYLDQGQAWWIHRLGMAFAFFLSAVLLVWFVHRMASALRNKAARLNAQREYTLRNEHIVALATLAAGTAHELGTPLNTMRLLADELTQQAPAELQSDLNLLGQQIETCKASLQRLVQRTQQLESPAQPLVHALQAVLRHWQCLRPLHSSMITWPQNPPELTVTWPETLNQALINLLNNAADASPDPIHIHLNWDLSMLNILIIDNGATPPSYPDLGLRPIASAQGMGVGFMLANASLEYYQGRVTLSREEGCTRTEIRLPLHALQVDA